MAYYLHLINSHKHCLSPYLLKLLVESLVFFHLSYALPVWGPSLNQQLYQRLEQTLSKFDHVSDHYRSLSWLPVQQLIQFRSVGMMYHQYHHSRGISLSPPIKFGRCQSVYDTRATGYFASLERFHLRFLQFFFGLRHPIGGTLSHPHLL